MLLSQKQFSFPKKFSMRKQHSRNPSGKAHLMKENPVEGKNTLEKKLGGKEDCNS